MRKLISCLAVLLACLLLAPAPIAGQKKGNTKNPVKRQQKLNTIALEIQQLQARAPAGVNAYRTAVAYKDFEVEVPEDVVVRRLNLPLEYDDKGNVKEYTEKEKKALRGSDP